MEKQPEESTLTTRSSRLSSLPCEECKLNPSKYKCPGCSVRSCSLPCVKAHKLRTDCTGKRPLTHFVPLSQFDDNQLISGMPPCPCFFSLPKRYNILFDYIFDYNLLEELKRVADSAQRKRVQLCGGYPSFKLPYHLQSLKRAANHRRTKLLFLPCGMSRREKNQSRYDQRKKFISWTIEWRFQSTDVALLDHGVNESSTLCSIIEKHLKPGPWNHQLRQFCKVQLDCLKFFICKYPKGTRSPYRELDIKAPICQQLANIVLLEYPIVHVFLPSHNLDFEIIKDSNCCLHKPDPRVSIDNHHSSPKGVPFKEEEIEENGGSSDPQVLDLMKHVESDHDFRLPQQCNSTTSSTKMSPHTNLGVDNDTAIHYADDSKRHTKSTTDNLDVPLNMDFDFEQGLIDAYSDLIAEINPDDFLDLDGGLTEDVVSEDHIDFGALFPVEEELEEGEIPGF